MARWITSSTVLGLRLAASVSTWRRIIGRRAAPVQGLVEGAPLSLQCRRSRVFPIAREFPSRNMDPRPSSGERVPEPLESGAVPRFHRPLLDHITGHDELKELPRALLPELAREIRSQLHETISRIPGHYASNLGVVELTIALHRAFDFRRDRLVLDVGHQCYPHKMLTGRARRFDRLRREGGLCGFPHPGESPQYDLFNPSHAGCAGSSALGLAVAGRMLDRKGRCVAVVGDGALTAGIAFEALNHAGHLKEDLLVVFNDNGCSISYNTGALSDACALLRGGRAVDPLDDLPGAFFRCLGFHYSGPIDGHDLGALEEWLESLKALRGPRLLHVITRKGRGFPWSEADPVAWHAGKPYV